MFQKGASGCRIYQVFLPFSWRERRKRRRGSSFRIGKLCSVVGSCSGKRWTGRENSSSPLCGKDGQLISSLYLTWWEQTGEEGGAAEGSSWFVWILPWKVSARRSGRGNTDLWQLPQALGTRVSWAEKIGCKEVNSTMGGPFATFPCFF